MPNGIRNTECDLFRFRYCNREMILKKLYFTNGNSFGNKLYTLEALSFNQEFIPNNFILPEFLVAINKRIEAFALPYVKGTNLSIILDNPTIDYEDKKYYLNNTNNSLTDYLIDENIDLYCYVIVILNYLYGENINNISIEEFYDYLNYLDSLKINYNLLECFERIVSNGNNINPVGYIDALTVGQIGQARKKYII